MTTVTESREAVTRIVQMNPGGFHEEYPAGSKLGLTKNGRPYVETPDGRWFLIMSAWVCIRVGSNPDGEPVLQESEQ